jgi:tetratricopeptide (TPR) repeat protein
MRALVPALALAGAWVITPASAAPSVWERARRASNGEDPAALAHAYREAVKLDAMATVWGADHGASIDVPVEDLRLRAVSALVSAGASRTDDAPTLRLLGAIYADLGRCEQAEPILRRAIERAPRHPASASAWFELALCASHRGDRAAEARAYERALEICDEPSLRAVLESNLAESRMGLGDVQGGIEAAERAIAIRDDSPIPFWNLAILRDRADDGAGALTAALQASALDPTYQTLDGPGVFFEPPYERRWYHALGALAAAERAKVDLNARRAALLDARKEYQAWLDAAAPDDRWRPLAIARLAWLDRRLAALPAPSASASAKAR